MQLSGKEVIVPGLFAGERVTAFFTTKALGQDVDAIASRVNVSPESIYVPIQEHTDRVLILDYDLQPRIADAVVTKRKGILVGVRVADCVPILLYDRVKSVVGAVHAGWRGTAAGILKRAIEAMAGRFSSSPSDILVAMGPAIRGCCYAVGHEVVEAVHKATGAGDYQTVRRGNSCIDLPAANKYQALSSGILPENIWIHQDCTHCFPEKYCSYRYARGPTGRQYGFIGML